MIETIKDILKGIDQTEIESSDGWWETSTGAKFGAEKLKQILELLAQTQEPPQRTEQEPFAWAEFDGEGGYYLSLYENNETYAEDWNKRNPNHIGWVEPIYKHPPQHTWVGLTGQEKAWIASVSLDVHDAVHRTDAKLKEKNT